MKNIIPPLAAALASVVSLTQHAIRRAVFAAAFALMLLAPAAFAATQYFSDAGGPKTWDTATSDWAASSGGSYINAWTLGSAPTFEGTAGTVNVGTGGNPTCGSPITFSVTGYTLTGGQITLNANSSFSEASSISSTINSVIGETGGSRSVTFAGGSGSSSIFTLGGANTFSGTSTLTAAKVSFNNLQIGGTPSSFGQGANTVAVIVGSNSSFCEADYTGGTASTDRPWTVNGTGANSIKNNSSSGAISFNNTGLAMAGTAGARSLTLAGSYTASANTFAEQLTDLAGFTTALTVSGNTWTLTGANTHSGGTTLGTSGVLNLGNATALGSGTFTASGNGSFDNTTSGDITVANAFTLSGGSPTYVGSAHNMTINGAVTLSGANRTITVSQNTLTLGGQITGAFTLTKAGSGTLVLKNAGTADTHSGTTISAGTLDLGGTSQSLGAVTFSGASTTQNGTINGSSFSATLASGSATVSASLAGGTAGLSMSAAGTLTLASATGNTYGGGTAISAGTVSLNAANQLGSGTSIGFTGNGSLQATAGLVIPSSTTITVNNTFTATFDNTTASGTGSTFEIAAKITGSGGAVKRASESSSTKGPIRFSNDANDYTGNFSTGYGLVEFTSVANGGSPSALGAASSAYGLGNGNSAFNFRYVGSGNTSTTRAIDWQGTTGGMTLDNTGSGTVQYLATGNLRSGASGIASLTLQGANINTLAQVINDASTPGATSLTKSGTGTWILTGANTYSGTTTISGGALLVNGSLASGSAVTVNNGGTNGGSGTINGMVTVSAGGTIQPSLSGSVNTLTLSSGTSPAFPTGANYATLKIRVPTSSTADKVNLSDATAAVFNCGNLNLSIDTTGLSGDTTGATIVQVGLASGGISGTFHSVTANNGYMAIVHYNTQTITVDLVGTITTSGTLSALSTTYGTASGTTSFSVSGTQLTGNLTVAPPSGYEVSTSSGSGYTTSLTLTPTSGTLAATTVYVRLAATTAAGSYSGNIQISGGGATTVNVATASSTVNPASLTVTANNQSRAYGVANPTLTYTITGYQNGENATTAGVTGAPSVSTTAGTSSPVGPYTITCAANNLSAANYTFSYVNGTLTIGQASTFAGASSSENPSGYKDSISFQATLPSDATGSVVFSSTNGAFSTNTVSSGTATSLSITNLPRGTNVITLAYLGEGNYIGSTNSLNQIVTNHPPVAAVMTVNLKPAVELQPVGVGAG